MTIGSECLSWVRGRQAGRLRPAKANYGRYLQPGDLAALQDALFVIAGGTFYRDAISCTQRNFPDEVAEVRSKNR